MTTSITTQSGVMYLGEASGTIEVESPDGSTTVELRTTDATGNVTVVFLDWHQVSQLMIALGAAAREL